MSVASAAHGAVHAPLLFFSGSFAFALALLAWGQRDGPGMRAFITVLAAASIWSLAKAGEILAVGLPAKIWWAKIEYLGITSLSPAWLAFVWGYCRPGRGPARAKIAMLALVPLATLVCVWTNESHRLIWAEVLASDASATGAVYRHGPLFWLSAAYSYALLGAGFLMLLVDASSLPGAQEKRQARRLLIGALVPVAANLVYLVGFGPRTGGDLTPAAFALTGAIYWFWALRGGLFDVLPYARAKVLETMRDGLLVLDRGGRVLEANRALCAALQQTRADLVGKPAPPVLALDAGWAAIEAGQDPERHDIELGGEVYGVTMDAVRNASGQTVGAVVAIRDVSRARRREATLRDEANRDTVTGIPNRRYLQTHAPRLLDRAREDAEAFTLVLCDIDYFKRYNDRHGHLQGDETLRAVAAVLSGNCRRATDFVARYGGEEFVLILPGMDARNAEAHLLKAFDALERAAIVHGDSPAGAFVTLSAGAVSLTPTHHSLDEILEMADRVLYAVKAQGRHAFRVCGPDEVADLPPLPAHRDRYRA
jgi:diguanylate cyclase (GGDEF)-like protein